nr:MAG TPA: hypothetical protein [Bacteriophage sp.]
MNNFKWPASMEVSVILFLLRPIIAWFKQQYLNRYI